MLELYTNPMSPCAQKVRIVLAEKGLEWTPHQVSLKDKENLEPWYLKLNPLGVVPTLVHDGKPVIESSIICEYLDDLHVGPRMFPASGESRWTALRRQALSDGIMDAAVSTRYETFLRPEPYRWTDWVDGQMGKVRRGLDALEKESPGDTLDIGTIAIGCALGYLDLRFPHEGWRDSRPVLAAWFEKVSARPSMTRTVPE